MLSTASHQRSLPHHLYLTTKRSNLVARTLSLQTSPVQASPVQASVHCLQHKQRNNYDIRTFATYNSNQTNISTPTSEQGLAACPTTIERPRLSPLPYIYLRNLPYNRSSDLQQRLVDRQIRLRKEREARIPLQNEPKSSTAPEGGSNDLILLVEHTPTYTNGRRNRGAHAVGDKEVERLTALGATYVESLRGGEITFHGPGQLVAYPILDLKPIQLSVRCYVSYLEKAIIATCAEWNVKAITTENTGVWINDQKKIAAIGVHVQRYVTSHGLALNCNTNLDYFKEIVACGLVGKETTSLSRELNDPSIDVQKVIPTFLKGFGATFNRELVPMSEANPELEKIIQDYVEFGYGNL
ncbi:putative lipoyltransferase 2, mitochondrial [Entomortierella chlamydospora]|uniref:lipoyl(octanoyl) transferase n=1 Tax=Entomortierella chlamydospora TaxID=101097 RepID=A0A9P6MTW3_9FUNG|nr:putative lipoyltransferase 2, mitochondrial [Entomortierella chlamydospora]KAG0012915.1 putative lipoyltransferase 2, mitochondrial [Entomortierella chlamydospora]